MLPNRCYFKKFSHWLIALASETIAKPFLTIYAKNQSPAFPSKPEFWRKGILLGADHVGDVLYRTTSLEHLAKSFPWIEWHWLVTSPADQVLVGNPYIKKVFLRNTFLSKKHLLDIFKQEQYDVALCYDTGGHVAHFKFALDAKIPNRIGYVHKGFSVWVNHPIPIQWPQPFAAYFRNLIEFLTQKRDNSPLRPKIYLNNSHFDVAEKYFLRHSIQPKNFVIIACPCSRQPLNALVSKEVFIEFVLKLNNAIQKVFRKKVIVIWAGTKEDFPHLQELQQKTKTFAFVCAGEMNLLEFAALIQKSHLLISQDSAPRHLANAVQTPCLFWRNQLTHPIETGPYTDSEFDLFSVPLSHQMEQAIFFVKEKANQEKNESFA